MRATISGNIVCELASARIALEAPGLRMGLPGAADEVSARNRELHGWMLREGVTNAIRHAAASRRQATMGANFLQIDDDGVAPPRPAQESRGNRCTGTGCARW